MKSITTKLSVAMILCMIAAVTLVSVIYMAQTREINDEASRKIITLICDDGAKALNAQLAAVERTVELMVGHSDMFLSDAARPFDERVRSLEAMSLQAASHTDEAYAVYFHLNPELYGSGLDFYYVRDAATDDFVKGKAYNPLTYHEETGYAADWYFASAKADAPHWLPPYYHKCSTDSEEVVVTSYTVPVHSADGALFGVLGMDYHFEGLSQQLDRIGLYNTGYAFLVGADSSIVYHPELPFGATLENNDEVLQRVVRLMKRGEATDELFRYRFQGTEKLMTFTPLRNGTYLMVAVPTAEINASVNKMLREGYVLFAVVLISSVMIIYCIIYKFIRPLQLLTYASQQIIKGNLQVELPYHAPDEIGELTENFRKMELYLQEHISKISTLAHTDAMTGLKNKASYQIAVNLLEDRMQQGLAEFALVVFDLNNLKHTNDTLGHAAGDRLIKNAGNVISKAFSHSPVFRIGGDEFVVLLENDDLRYYLDCEEKLKRLLNELNEQTPPEERVSIAYGMARYEADKDDSYRSVFARADKEMYNHKLSIKGASHT